MKHITHHLTLNTHLIILALISFHISTSNAAPLPDSLDIKMRVGYNLGGTSPLPLPASIRSFDAFRPTFSPVIGADITSHLSDTWGLSAGLRVENKGMDAEVTVKSYRMEMTKGTTQLSGLFTGHVKQEVTQWMITLPIYFTLHLSPFTFKAGPYFSLLVSKDFSGIASDGYLRQGDPTGPKVDIGDKEGEWATYDFSGDMRPLQWGVSLGLDWLLAGHLGLSADLQWGLSSIFQSDFKTIEQTLWPIYGSLGLFYKLN